MALWGNNDNVAYLYNGAVGGTVSVDYDNLEVTGTGTTFGTAGYAQTGDVIRIGFRGTGGVYFGDATIVGIASTTSLSIASTDGLSGASIANTSYWISELPQWTPQNPHFSMDNTFSQSTPGFHTTFVGTALTFARGTETGTPTGAGVSCIPVNLLLPEIEGLVEAGDYFLNDDEWLTINGIGSCVIAADGHSPVGHSTVYFTTNRLPGVSDGSGNFTASAYYLGPAVSPTAEYTVSSVGTTAVTLGSTISAGIATGDILQFTGDVVSLASTITAGIATDAQLSFGRVAAGFSAHVYGISTEGVGAAQSTAYETGAGWVGVTTYYDASNNLLRVKKEILVAMSGISTGPAGIAGTAGNAYPPSDD